MTKQHGRRRVAAPLAAALLALVGCGTGESSTADPTTTAAATDATSAQSAPTSHATSAPSTEVAAGDLCDLLDLATLVEIARVKKLDVAQQTDESGAQVCQVARGARLGLTVHVSDEADPDLTQALQGIIAVGEKPRTVRVAGAEALVVASAHPGIAHAGVVTLAGNRLVRVVVEDVRPKGTIKIAKKLALTAAEMAATDSGE